MQHKTIGRLRRSLIVCVLAMAAALSIVPASANAAEPGLTIPQPSLSLTMGEIARLSGEPTSSSGAVNVLVVSSSRGSVTWQEFADLANGKAVPGIKIVRQAQGVAPSTTVGSLTNGEPPREAKGCGPICRKILKFLLKVLCWVLILL